MRIEPDEFAAVDGALRDILFLYYDLVPFGGIGGDNEYGTFDAWRYVDATLDPGYWHADVQQLLNEGSAVALLSRLVDCWSQGGGHGVEPYRAAFAAGRFDHLPAARAALAGGVKSEDAMYPALNAVYEQYVLALFARLAESGAPSSPA